MDVIGMVESYKVKITVLKCFHPSEVFETSPVTPSEPLGACEVFKEGQEFVIDIYEEEIPKDFCSDAWSSINWALSTLSAGGNIPYYKEKGVAVSCCTDGLRPVIFKMERI